MAYVCPIETKLASYVENKDQTRKISNDIIILKQKWIGQWIDELLDEVESQAFDLFQLTKEPPELSSSVMFRLWVKAKEAITLQFPLCER